MKSSVVAAQEELIIAWNYFVDVETDRNTDKRSEMKLGAF